MKEHKYYNHAETSRSNSLIRFMRNSNKSLFGIGIFYGFSLIKPALPSTIPISSKENF